MCNIYATLCNISAKQNIHLKTVTYVSLIFSLSKSIHKLKPVKGEVVQAFHFLKHDFEQWDGGDGLDMCHVPTTRGWFMVHAYNAAHVRHRSKTGSKTIS